MNKGIATAVGVTAVIVIVLGFVALAAIEDGDPGAPSATPTTADISPSPERTFPSPLAESPTVGTTPTGSPTQPGTATTAPPGTSPSPGTQPTPSPTSTASPDVAMTGPALPQSALWLGLVPLFMGALAARSLRRAPGK